MAQYKTFSTMASDPKPKNTNVFPEVISVDSVKSRNDLITKNSVVVIYYYATWCSPCKDFSEKYNEIAHFYAGKGILLVKEDVDLDINNKGENVNAVPCFHFYKNGVFQEKMTLTGVDEEAFTKNMQNLI